VKKKDIYFLAVFFGCSFKARMMREEGKYQATKKFELSRV